MSWRGGGKEEENDSVDVGVRKLVIICRSGEG